MFGVERAGGAGLLLEAAQAFASLRNRGGQDLDRHLARARVARAIDSPSRGAKKAEDLVGTEARARREDPLAYCSPSSRYRLERERWYVVGVRRAHRA